jgi:hypothetical protein
MKCNELHNYLINIYADHPTQNKMHAAIWRYILLLSHTKKHTVSTVLIAGILPLISFLYTTWRENLS